ncbi:MAG: flavodoxin domain-containing protein [Prosthecobacter sp.]|jgi:sulfite reductase alpha subunit-like flavoprotein|uniref:flavodoxin domain-containing protein n=1 Tax=Prosthecobacter sp. TaxID=1965333 RepID=UPI0019E88FB8|nr:flavodoxin domain-containing protein [Prosthecobacter sp.]MBE2284397.1 flavodoxin domain-containing protein [Prosthecobacter sp.]
MAKPLLILFGTVTGNAEICAERAADAARARGYDVTIESMASTEPEVLTQFPTALLTTSTYGDGDPPDGTEAFYEAVVHSKRVLFTRLRYSVLALGDSCYDQFCKCGKDYDDALERLGGTRLYPRADCDTDYDDGADRWIEGVFAALEEERALLAA